MSRQIDWVQVAPGVYAPPDGPGQLLTAILLRTAVHEPRVWHRESLRRDAAKLPLGLPAGAKHISIGGIAILASDFALGTNGLALYVRRADSGYNPPYIVQVGFVNQRDVAPTQGVRQNAMTGVCLNHAGEFEWMYEYQTPDGKLPPGIGLNFPVQEWKGLPDLFPWAEG